MQGGLADRFKNPEYKPPTLEDGGTPSTLRQVLTRNAARLAPGAVNKLVPILAMKTNGKPSHEVAATVERFLGSREAHPFLAVQPKPRAADGRFAEPPTSNRPSRPIKTNF